MNWEEKIEGMAAKARAERAPQVDVTCSVLSILASGGAQRVTTAERLWMWLAAASAAVATPAAVVAGILYRSSAGPLRELVDSIVWAM